MTEPTPLTLLGMPKPFRGHIGVIQRNAIQSWTKLLPRPEIYLCGIEDGVPEVAAEFRVHHIPEMPCNEFGTLLLGVVLERAREISNTPILCYANCDIILLQEFADAIAVVQRQFAKFLAVAQRTNIDLAEELNFNQDGEKRLRSEILPVGKTGHHTAIDVFVFPREMYQDVPPLALGRAWFDQWLIKDARKRNVPVVDLSHVARAIHQNHEYGHIAGGQKGAYWGEEAQRSLAIYGGVPHEYTLLDVSHEMLADRRIRRVRYRRERFEVRQWFWTNFIERTAAVRKRLGLRRRESLPKEETAAKT
jgi:hypothetical protein